MAETDSNFIIFLSGMLIGGAIFTAIKLLRDLLDTLKDIKNGIKQNESEII